MPNPFSEYLLSAQGVRQLDSKLHAAGLLDITMEHAGRAVADELARRWPDLHTPLLILAGSGANGGDAWVAARHLLTLGYAPNVLALSAKHPLTQLNRRRAGRLGLRASPLNKRSLQAQLRARPVVVDGLLGTGFTPPLRPALAELLEVLDAAQRPTLAIDLPTGLQADSAQKPDQVLKAQVTVALGSLKTALVYGPASHAAGEVVLAPLRLPSEWLERESLAQRPRDAGLAQWLPRRFADAHKGTAGRVWILGGQPGTLGAPLLAGRAALRTGAGLVTVYSPAELPLLTPELMLRPLNLAALAAERKPEAVAAGMGLGPEAAQVARMVLGWRVPTVLDADALQAELAGAGHDQVIWTPHPGEAARLLGVETADITRDPLAAARDLQARLGGVVVLKGGPSTVATSQGLYLSRGGHPGMATAGMGDTLSGILAALLAQGLDAAQAALVGVRLHALAGEWAAQQHGYGLIASDVADSLGKAWEMMMGDG